MNKFRVMVRFPIGVVTVGRPKELAAALRHASSVHHKLGGKCQVEIVPDCQTYRRLDAERDAEDASIDDVVGPVDPPAASPAEPSAAKTYTLHRPHDGELVTSKEQLAAARAEAERCVPRLGPAAGDEVPWLLERIAVVIAAGLAWCWWRCRCVRARLLGEEKRA